MTNLDLADLIIGLIVNLMLLVGEGCALIVSAWIAIDTSSDEGLNLLPQCLELDERRPSLWRR